MIVFSNDCIDIHRRAGQALVESLVVFLGVALLFLAIAWLGRLLDINLQTENASRYAAFELTRRFDGIDEKSIHQKFFLGKEHQWADRRQQKIISAQQVSIDISKPVRLSNEAQAGQDLSLAKTLRQEWGIEDKGIAHIQIKVIPHYQPKSSQNNLGFDAGFWERLRIPLRHHTAILVDAGHSASDVQSHSRAASSSLAWQEAAHASYALGKHIQQVAAPMEGFGREKVVFDWMRPWAGKIPSQHLPQH